MVNRNLRVRTPRRRKLWAGYHAISDVTTASSPHEFDVLDPTLTDLGVSNLGGLTVMRVVGQITMTQWTAGAVTPAYDNVDLGLAWLDKNVAATSGAALPDPQHNGTRDTNWYQQWSIGGLENVAPAVVSAPLTPVEHSTTGLFDVKNQQRQPNADAKFMLIATNTGLAEADTYRLTVRMNILLALP